MRRIWLGRRLRSIVFCLLRGHFRCSSLAPILGGGNRRGDGIEVGDELFGDTLGSGLVKQPDGRIKGVHARTSGHFT